MKDISIHGGKLNPDVYSKKINFTGNVVCKCVRVCVCVYVWACECAQSHDSLQPHGLEPTRLFCSWNFLGKKLEEVAIFSSSGDLPDSGIKHTSPRLLLWQVDSLLIAPATSPTWEVCKKR